MIDISQDGQDKNLEEAKMLMEQMAKEKKGQIKTDKDNQKLFILSLEIPTDHQDINVIPLFRKISLIPAKLDKQVELSIPMIFKRSSPARAAVSGLITW